jgi:hypothetical protein
MFLEGIEVPCVSAATQVNFDAPATCVVQTIPTPAVMFLKPRTAVEVFYRDLRSDSSEYKLYFTGEIFAFQYNKTPTQVAMVFQCIDDSSYWDTAYQYYVDYGRGDSWLFQSRASFGGTGSGLFGSIFRGHASVLGGLLRTRPKTYPGLSGLNGGMVHVLEAVGGIPGNYRGFNDFFSMAELRRKILAQISASEADDSSVRMYNHKVFWKWLMRQLGSAGSMVTVRDMIKLIFQYIFHNVVPNPIAKYERRGKTNIKRRKVKWANTPRGKRMLKEAQHVLTLINRMRTKHTALAATFTTSYQKLTTKVFYDSASVKENVRWENRGEFNVSPMGIRTPKLTRIVTETRSNKVEFSGDALKEAMQPLTAKYAEMRSALPMFITNIKAKLTKLKSGLRGPSSATVNAALENIKNVERVFKYGEEVLPPKFTNPKVARREFVAIFKAMIRLATPAFLKDLQPFRALAAQLNKKLAKFTALNKVVWAKFPAQTTRPTPEFVGYLDVYLGAMGLAIEDLVRSLGGKVVTVASDLTKRERLHNQIFRPDVWFVAPPKCNVLFPDDYLSFQYARNFFQEITRMNLTTSMSLIGSNRLTNSRHVAPNIPDVTGEHTLESAKKGVRLILPHEVYTGILPSYEFTTTMHVYAASSSQKRAIRDQLKLIQEQIKYLNEQKATLKRADSTNTTGKSETIRRYQSKIDELEGRASSLEAGGIPFIQRAVNFLFFKKRFAARSMQVNAQFTDRLVAGFPCVVLDRPPTIEIDHPNHFIGMIAAMNHSATMDGGATSVTFSQARQHSDNDDDYLNLDHRKLVKLAQTRKTGIRTATAFLRLEQVLLRLSQLGYSGGRTQVVLTGNALKEQKKLNKEKRKLLAELKWVNRIATLIRGKVKKVEGTKVLLNPKELTNLMIGKIGPKGGRIVKVTTSETSPVPLVELSDIKSKLGGTDHRETRLKALAKNKAYGFDSRNLYFHQYTIYEKFEGTVRELTMPVEEQVYPTWLSPVYRNEQIGRKELKGKQGPYQQFFGCGAITDDPADTPELRRELDKQLKENAANVHGTLKPSKSIKEAIEELASVYKSLRDREADIRKFIEDYGYRPIASLEDIMGAEGVPGFRTGSYGDLKDLQGFPKSSVRPAKFFGGKGRVRPVASALDTRSEKHKAVMKYREELNRGTGQLGG